MKKQLCLFLTILLFGSSLIAETIKDVPTDDADFKAMNTAVKKGYLSLYSNNAFRPTQPLTRKEFAAALDAFALDIKQSNMSLTQADIQELNNLSKTFKGDFTGMSGQLALLIKSQSVHSDEIQTLHHDLSKVDDELRQEIAQLKKQRLYTWIGIGAAIILGVAR